MATTTHQAELHTHLLSSFKYPICVCMYKICVSTIPLHIDMMKTQSISKPHGGKMCGKTIFCIKTSDVAPFQTDIPSEVFLWCSTWWGLCALSCHACHHGYLTKGGQSHCSSPWEDSDLFRVDTTRTPPTPPHTHTHTHRDQAHTHTHSIQDIHRGYEVSSKLLVWANGCVDGVKTFENAWKKFAQHDIDFSPGSSHRIHAHFIKENRNYWS
jgi:hypothetical protein